MKHVITPSSSAGRLNVKPGDVVEIRLDEIPATGYQWQVKDYDQRVLQLHNEDFALEKNGAIGSGGEKVITFSVLNEGQASINLQHQRQWMSDNDQKFEIEIHSGD